MRYHYILIRMAKVQNSNNTKRWQGCRVIGILIIAGEMQNSAVTLEDSSVIS